MFGTLFDFSLFNFEKGPHATACGASAGAPADVLGSCHGACENCGVDDWTLDDARGDLVCFSCGACVDFHSVHAPSRADQKDALASGRELPSERLRQLAFGVSRGVADKAKRRRGYKRKEYLRERFNQWFLEEPAIHADDWIIIEQEFIRWHKRELDRTPRIYTGRQLARTHGTPFEGAHILTRAEVRSILAACDALKEKDYPWPLDARPKNYFRKKFLERWLTIRWRFSGQGSTSKYVPGDLVELIFEDFERLEEAHQRVARAHKRKSMPYNTVIYRTLELYNCQFLADDFPQLSTRRAAMRAEYLWWDYCDYLQWPYISEQAEILKPWKKRGKDGSARGFGPPDRSKRLRRSCQGDQSR